MKSLKSILSVCALIALGALSAPVGAATDLLPNANPLPPSLEEKARDVRAVLEAGGFQVARGYWRLWSAEDCRYPLKSIGNCYGNNPTAPYVLAQMPPPARYFGLQTNVFTRVGEPNPADPLYSSPPAGLDARMMDILFGTSSNPAHGADVEHRQ